MVNLERNEILHRQRYDLGSFPQSRFPDCNHNYFVTLMHKHLRAHLQELHLLVTKATESAETEMAIDTKKKKKKKKKKRTMQVTKETTEKTEKAEKAEKATKKRKCSEPVQS